MRYVAERGPNVSSALAHASAIRQLRALINKLVYVRNPLIGILSLKLPKLTVRYGTIKWFWDP